MSLNQLNNNNIFEELKTKENKGNQRESRPAYARDR